jgi:thymidine kinase
MDNIRKAGQFYAYCGPMFLGKTSALMSILEREKMAKQFRPERSFMVFNHISDTRYGEGVVATHDGRSHPAHCLETSDEVLSVYRRGKSPNTVLIDELMFFDSGIVKVIDLMRREGTDVHGFFLDQTSEGEPFPFSDEVRHVGELLTMAYQIEKRRAVCSHTGGEATVSNCKVPKVGAVKVGGKDVYEAVSLDVWYRLN